MAAVAQPITDRAQSSSTLDGYWILMVAPSLFWSVRARDLPLCGPLDCPLSPLAFAAPIGAGNEHAVPHTRQSVSVTCPPQARPCHGRTAARARGTPAPCQPLFAAPRMDGAHLRPAARAPPARAPATAAAPPSTTLSRGGAGGHTPLCLLPARMAAGLRVLSPPPHGAVASIHPLISGKDSPIVRVAIAHLPLAHGVSRMRARPPLYHPPLPSRVFPFCHSPLPASTLREDR